MKNNKKVESEESRVLLEENLYWIQRELVLSYHWERLNKPFQNVQKQMDTFKTTLTLTRINESQKTLRDEVYVIIF